MRVLWLLYLTASAADLYLSILNLNPEMEANPLAAWTWAAFGYKGLILFKILTILVIYFICNSIYNKSRLAAKCVMTFGVCVTTLTCLLFGAIYI